MKLNKVSRKNTNISVLEDGEEQKNDEFGKSKIIGINENDLMEFDHNIDYL